MDKAIIIAAVLSLASGAAAAQGTEWTGLYGGVSMATTSGSHDYSDDDFYDLEGPAFGAFGGYMWGNGNLVYGAEVALTLGGVYEVELERDGGESFKDSYEYDRFVDVKGRLGYAVSDFLVYGTLGMTQGRFKADIGSSDQVNTYPTGVAYGLGADYSFGDRFFAGADYTRRDFDFFEDNQAVDIDANLDVLTLRLGMKF